MIKYICDDLTHNPKCKKCGLHKTCRTICVPSRMQLIPSNEGYSDYVILAIGEAPGETEDITGKPFMGHAGRLLDLLMSQGNLMGTRVIITNAVKCRPPENRTPENFEIKACGIYLREEINQYQPDVIVTLGKTAFLSLFPKVTNKNVSLLRKLRFRFSSIPVVPTFHPSAALRNSVIKRLLLEDLQKIKPLILKQE